MGCRVSIGKASPPSHGGRISAFRHSNPDAPTPVLDLSTGINPFAYPVPALPAHVWSALPDPDDLATLERIAAEQYGVADASRVVAAPGSQCLIGLLPLCLGGRNRIVNVVGPTYAEHAASWVLHGHRVVQTCRFPDPDQKSEASISIVCNPNNPDGTRYTLSDLRILSDRMADQKGWLIVDEAFADFEKGIQSIGTIQHSAAIALRSFGKAYGLAGLRLGFAILPPDHADFLRRILGPWPVSGAAITIARAALTDHAWQQATMARLEAAAERLDRLLISKGFEILGGTSLFRLTCHPDNMMIHDRLNKAGIMTRRFDWDDRLFRFGLPKSNRDWNRLDHALS
ncbi:Threonine-phosphate decarboxylase [Granulibacter bethesdensis CGDNIH1]|uniref:threonine-phosphate decarboxylase n=1 Tax=Granulibacter bethesdensis (strain ATCC BAA-1260 / CGDNIH1) TaxID=391165 RepID=Q0BUF2_GRABC|nr:Threonine-phosphate decarboxylase [Granulibacter bethesdensis CGDNIH1]APH51349.1 Threonine-phosphate decarboxylase [Granulibacter bethesdensis]APH64042.1 Threonine-phosphate decarboxylase [Granulibacter bethesdensis]